MCALTCWRESVGTSTLSGRPARTPSQCLLKTLEGMNQSGYECARDVCLTRDGQEVECHPCESMLHMACLPGSIVQEVPVSGCVCDCRLQCALEVQLKDILIILGGSTKLREHCVRPLLGALASETESVQQYNLQSSKTYHSRAQCL